MTALTNPADLRKRGLEVLVRELGFVDAMRFMLQFETGRGDYTTERDSLFPARSDDEFLREAGRYTAAPNKG
jgi:hypothetical protein